MTWRKYWHVPAVIIGWFIFKACWVGLWDYVNHNCVTWRFIQMPGGSSFQPNVDDDWGAQP